MCTGKGFKKRFLFGGALLPLQGETMSRKVKKREPEKVKILFHDCPLEWDSGGVIMRGR